MNNINCEHCGSLIDVNKNFKCPNCGAPYKNNKQYKEYKEYKKRQSEIELETKKLANDITRDVHDTTKRAVPVIFVIMLFIFVFIIFVSYSIFKTTTSQNVNNNYNYYPSSIDDYIKQIEELNNYSDTEEINNNQEEITVSFNEYASTNEFDIKVDKIKEYVEKRFTSTNKTYYGFHIEFNNKTDKWKILDAIELTYLDENGLKTIIEKPNVSTKSLDFYATQKLKYEGYLYFDIPKNVKDVVLVFENVNIKIDNYKNKIK